MNTIKQFENERSARRTQIKREDKCRHTEQMSFMCKRCLLLNLSSLSCSLFFSQLAVVMWLLTYVGAVFNGITILILGKLTGMLTITGNNLRGICGCLCTPCCVLMSVRWLCCSGVTERLQALNLHCRICCQLTCFSLSSSRHPALHGAPHLREEQGESQALFQQFVNMAVSSECSLHQTLKALCGPDNMKSLAH